MAFRFNFKKCGELFQKPIPVGGLFEKRWARMGAYGLLFLLGLKLVAFLVPIPKQGLFPPSSTLVFDADGKLLRAFTAPDGIWRISTSLDQISPVLQKFLIAYEDQLFYRHPGVNPLAIIRAYRQNKAAGRIVAGGSTITMQIARMSEPKERTWYHKLVEIARAIQLEQRFGKRRLLEIYFNIAPYGGNIEGVAAASWLYFGKEPTQLSHGEAALLAALPNSPSRLRPDLYPERARRARDKVLGIVYRKGLITKREYEEALAEPVPDARRELPFIAPQFCQELKDKYPGKPRIYSTLKLNRQLLAETLLKEHLKGLDGQGISNGAVVIIDNRSRALLAAVGSADFFDNAAQGQVNGYRAPRSPGSALKPFVYALGFEHGVITPQHYLEDVPIDFSGGYSPENFDKKFNGIVSAREALGRSLNVPVINVLLMLGENGLYPLLRRINLSTVAADDRYGLTIALGGCEVTLIELTALYSALANGGIYRAPQLTLEQPQNPSTRLFSAGAAYLVTEILSEISRPDLPACWEFTSLPKIAWKTGTSYGYRDAWSIGYNPRYTIGVWIGNFSGEGRPGLIGAEAAAPLLFDLFNKVDSGEQGWFTSPATVDTRQVCAVSGLVPGRYCENLITESYLTDCSPDQECSFHQSYLLDPRSGYRLPPHYHSSTNAVEKTFIKWPPRIAAWREANGYPVERIPPLIPEWQRLQPGQAPVIRSPSENYVYHLREGIALEFQKICLEAAAANDVHKLYWFVDGKLLGVVAPGERLFYMPEVGGHRVVCQDDQGRSAEMRLVIEE
ncbi:MAG: penicillin-binding protein 1C [Firmicutes bacterium]|nr:penicillin-binding protein 1C [Bacillota bacterium]